MSLGHVRVFGGRAPTLRGTTNIPTTATTTTTSSPGAGHGCAAGGALAGRPLFQKEEVIVGVSPPFLWISHAIFSFFASLVLEVSFGK